MSAQTRRITIIILGFLTLLLLGLAIFIAIRLTQGVAPDDSSAATCDDGGIEACQTADGVNTGFYCRCVAVATNKTVLNCGQFDTSRCPITSTSQSAPPGKECNPDSTETGSCGSNGCAANQVGFRVCSKEGTWGSYQCARSDTCGGGGSSSGSSTGGGSCVIDNPSPYGSYITVGSGCTSAQLANNLQVFIRNAPPGSTNETCSAAGSTGDQSIAVTPGATYRPTDFSTQCGTCIQIDLAIVGGGSYGTRVYTGDCASSTTSTTAAYCGDGVKSGSEQCDPTATPSGCANGLNCASNCTCTTNPVCGSTCTAPGTQSTCPVGTTCNTLNGQNVCTLTGCTSGTCTENMCNPLCGGPCDPVAGPLCPNGHTCDPTTNRCILTSCSGSNAANCSANKCAVIPDTAIFFSDEGDRLVLGAMLILLGFIAIRFQLIDKAYMQLVTNWKEQRTSTFTPAKEESRVSKQVNKERDRFEEDITRNL